MIRRSYAGMVKPREVEHDSQDLPRLPEGSRTYREQGRARIFCVASTTKLSPTYRRPSMRELAVACVFDRRRGTRRAATPKSSASSNASGTCGQGKRRRTDRRRALRRRGLSCASTCLPVPVSPSSTTSAVLLRGAARLSLHIQGPRRCLRRNWRT